MKVKRCLSILLVLVMVVIAIPVMSTNKVQGARMRMNYAYYTMAGGMTLKLKAYVSGKVKWKSSNKKIASVSSKGKVTAKKKGKCTIIAKKGKYKGKVKITVTSDAKPKANFKKTTLDVSALKIDYNDISFDKTGHSVINGKRGHFKLVLKNNKKKVKWSSTKKTVAIVSKKGYVTVVKPGSCKIVAKVGKKKYKCSVHVTNLLNAKKIENQKDAYEMLKMINDARIKAKVKPLKIMEPLMRAAAVRSKEVLPAKIIVNKKSIMIDKNMSHRRPDGRSYNTAIFEQGLSKGWHMGENISFVADIVTQRAEFLETCFKAFMADKKHRDNILRSDYSHVGLAHDDSILFTNYHGHPSIAVFWEQLFYSKK